MAEFKTWICDCFSGKDTDIRPNSPRIIEGMEHGKDLVDLVGGIVLQQTGDGQYITRGKPGERWAEVLEARIGKNGAMQEAEIIGYIRLEESAASAAAARPAVRVKPKRPQPPRK